jgi:hypothetical protein
MNSISNYRPLSLLTSFLKIYEDVVYARLYKYLIDDNILVNEQSGFRVNFSTDKVTYKLLNDILNALINKLIVGSIF